MIVLFVILCILNRMIEIFRSDIIIFVKNQYFKIEKNINLYFIQRHIFCSMLMEKSQIFEMNTQIFFKSYF